MKNRLHFFRTVPMLALVAFFASSCYAPPQGEYDNTTVVQNYVPPPWAPPYDNVSTVRYYYLPDCEVYYDVWERQFWYLGNGEWLSSYTEPPPCGGLDLDGAFMVLIDRDVDQPWTHHDYYRENYPRHGYDRYKDIVVHNRIVTNVAPGHELVPRAFNENTNRVTFMQRPTTPQVPPAQPPQPALGGDRRQNGDHQIPIPPAPALPPLPARYHHVVHEVPMGSISPSMPTESKSLNYGAGYSKGRAPQGTARSTPQTNTRNESGNGSKK